MKKNYDEIFDNKETYCLKGKNKAEELAISFAREALSAVKEGRKEKINAIWLETSGCFGEVISFLNSINPDILYILKEIVNITFLGSISGDQGERAYKNILDTLDTEYVFLVCGAVPTKSNGLYTTLATYEGKVKTAMEVVSIIAEKAKYILAIGTCACYGGPTAGRPNLSEASSVRDFLDRKDVIQIPGCPANPVWTVGTLGYLVSRGMPQLDSDGRPVDFYGFTIHDKCPRRAFFDNNIFAKKMGDPECMFELGCRGPITKAYCPISRWNNSENWPIGDNTTCIGCAGEGFPDKTAPYVIYGGE